MEVRQETWQNISVNRPGNRRHEALRLQVRIRKNTPICKKITTPFHFDGALHDHVMVDIILMCVLDCEPFSIGSRDGFRYIGRSLSKRYVPCSSCMRVPRASSILEVCCLDMINSELMM